MKKLHPTLRNFFRSDLLASFSALLLINFLIFIAASAWLLYQDLKLFIGIVLLEIMSCGAILTYFYFNLVWPLRALSKPDESDPDRPRENEITRVARRIETLEEAISKSEQKIAAEHKKIDTIFSLQFDAEDPPTLDKFFRQALGIVQAVTGFETITMRLFDPVSHSFKIAAQKGMSPLMVKELESIPADWGFHAEVFERHWPVFTSNMATDPRMFSKAPIMEGYHSLVCIPLLAQDILVGSIQIATRDQHEWDEDELRWLALIGRRTGILIHQIQLHERLRDMAVLEERSRIAQEIHDGLAQLIGSLRIWSEEALTFLKENRLDQVEKALEKTEAAARDAYTSLREEMLGLRDTIAPSKDLPSVITEYLKRFHRQWGVQTRLQVESSADRQQSWQISPAAEIQLLRILQEGMTNVRRHAHASSLLVALSESDCMLQVLIQDDGEGFDQNIIPEDKFGLKIMRDRACSVGGAIEIHSKVGLGTQLKIYIPLTASQNMRKVGL